LKEIDHLFNIDPRVMEIIITLTGKIIAKEKITLF
jgi:ABC-type uncharacterized transport system ATPase component